MTLNIVIFGLSITSAWGNGHATTFRALIKALARRGHAVTFLERDVPWYAEHRDMPDFPHATVLLYGSVDEARERFAALVADADVVMVGSYVPDGAAIGDWVVSHARGTTAFYDIDTPVTIAGLDNGKVDYLRADLIPRYDLYLSFTGGPVLERLEGLYGSPCARALYCAVDPDLHSPADTPMRWTFGYLGTYSHDRQPKVEELLLRPAAQQSDERFVVAGAQYPADIAWPANVARIEHLPPRDHAKFYCAQRYTLNVTRADMIAWGYSPSVRLFEAAACGVPIISDRWQGLSAFFAIDEEIFVADTTADVLAVLADLPEERRIDVGRRAQARVLRDHTADHRAEELEGFLRDARTRRHSHKEKRRYA